MKTWISTLAFTAAALFATAGHAASHTGAAPMAAATSCDAKAAEKKLAGAAKSSFLKKCSADNPAAPAMMASSAMAGGPSCEAKAAEKKLAGAAKTSFVKKCASDDKGATAATSCDMKAADKKLAGAAKTSFVKKCVADAGA